jgi:hypothetical protein
MPMHLGSTTSLFKIRRLVHLNIYSLLCENGGLSLVLDNVGNRGDLINQPLNVVIAMPETCIRNDR